jgi:hypothetical protein
MLTWFAPDIHFFAQRGFAGSVDYFGGHWSEPAFSTANPPEARHRHRAARHPPREFRRVAIQARCNPLIENYLRQHYVDAGESQFTDTESSGNPYRVWGPQGLATNTTMEGHRPAVSDRTMTRRRALLGA